MATGAEDLFAALQWVGMFKAVGKADASTSLATSQHRTPPQLAPMTFSHTLQALHLAQDQVSCLYGFPVSRTFSP